MSEQQTNKPVENSATPEIPEQQQQNKNPGFSPSPPVKRNYQRFTPNLIEVSRAHQVKKTLQPIDDDSTY